MSTEISAELAKKMPLGQIREVKHLLMNNNAREQLAMVAAKHMNPERMMRIVANAIRTTPKLGQCQPLSVLGALMQCAALGLEPNTVLGHAYMIPFDKRAKDPKTGKWGAVSTDVQLIIGYKGLIDLARRSGHITSISANIHREDDDLWEYEEGLDAKLRHRPGLLRGKKLHAYAIAKFKDGGHAFAVLPWAKIIEIRDASQGWQQAVRTGKTAETPWGKHEDEMAKKTAIRHLSKYLPLSTEFISAVEVDGRQADYSGFAFDPTMGVAQTEDDTIDGQAEEIDTGRQQIESKPAAPDGVARELVETNRRAAAQARYREELKAKGKPAAVATPPAPEQQKVTQDPPEPDHQLPLDASTDDAGPEIDPDQIERLENWTNTIIADLHDGSHPDEVRDVWEPQITMIAAQAPALMAKITEAMNEARG